MLSKRVFALCMILSLFGCKQGADHAEEYMKAYEKQKEVLVALEDIEAILEADTTSRYDSLAESVHEIEKSLFEIPGYHLELRGHEGHDHSHGEVELSAEEVLAVQVDLLQRLKDIKWILTNDQ